MNDITETLNASGKILNSSDVRAYLNTKKEEAIINRIKDRFDNDEGITFKELFDFVKKNNLMNSKITVYNDMGDLDDACLVYTDGKEITIES